MAGMSGEVMKQLISVRRAADLRCAGTYELPLRRRYI